MKKNIKSGTRKNKYGVLLLAILLIGAGFFLAKRGPESSKCTDGSFYVEKKYICRDEVVRKYWDEIRQHLSGTTKVVGCPAEKYLACNLVFDVDISEGRVEDVRFKNGPLDLSETFFPLPFNEYGLTPFMVDETSWVFKLDMDSSFVENAIDEWARRNGYLR